MFQNRILFISFFFTITFTACNNHNNSSFNTADTTADTRAATDGTVADTSSRTLVPLSETDRNFVLDAARGGLMEIEAGKIAQEKASSKRIKDLADMMVRDHTQSNQELQSLAASKNIILPDTLEADMKEHIESIGKMKGKDFDKHYISMMKDDHTRDINKFDKAAKNASDTDLKAFAIKTLPVLQAHNDSVELVSKSVQ